MKPWREFAVQPFRSAKVRLWKSKTGFLADLKKYNAEKFHSGSYQGTTVQLYRDKKVLYIVYFNTRNTMIHELVHVVFFEMARNGVKLDPDNDEMFCLVLDRMLEKT